MKGKKGMESGSQESWVFHRYHLPSAVLLQEVPSFSPSWKWHGGGVVGMVSGPRLVGPAYASFILHVLYKKAWLGVGQNWVQSVSGFWYLWNVYVGFMYGFITVILLQSFRASQVVQ